MAHQARGGVGGRGERQDLARRERVLEGREGPAYQQRLTLPMVAHEGLDIEAPGLWRVMEIGLESIRL
jgi:hypothetical protein